MSNNNYIILGIDLAKKSQPFNTKAGNLVHTPESFIDTYGVSHEIFLDKKSTIVEELVSVDPDDKYVDFVIAHNNSNKKYVMCYVTDHTVSGPYPEGPRYDENYSLVFIKKELLIFT